MKLNLQYFGGRGAGASGTGSANGYKVPSKISNISHSEAEKLFNAPVGTKITITKHQSGDYVGEYTRTKDGWVGSQQYKSAFKNLPTVKTPKGFAMQVVGSDIKPIKK